MIMQALKQKWKHSVNVLVLLVKMWIPCRFKAEVLGDIKDESEFVGYDQLAVDAKVAGNRKKWSSLYRSSKKVKKYR